MLVSKKITLNAGDPAVELLAGEETEQSYELNIFPSGPAPTYIGGSDVNSTDSVLLFATPLRVRGESLWVIGPSVGSSSTTLSILAYSTE